MCWTPLYIDKYDGGKTLEKQEEKREKERYKQM